MAFNLSGRQDAAILYRKKLKKKLLQSVSKVCRYQTLTIQGVQTEPTLLTVMRPQNKRRITKEKTERTTSTSKINHVVIDTRHK